MTMNKYFITLKPIEDYFFGSENTFRSNENQNETNYFARSNPYPQQTSLLGLLRYLLLESNNALPLSANKSKADVLIGKKSFDVNQKEQEQNFGVINKISPLYIYNDKEKKIYRLGLDYEKFTLDFSEDGIILLNTVKNFDVKSKDYNPKKDYGTVLFDKDGNTLAFSDVFKELNPRIGIEKEREQSDEKKMYKQVFYTLNEEYHFAFYAELNDEENEIDVKLNQKGIVFFGGEQKQFQYKTIKEGKDDYINEPNFKVYGTQNKIVLMSDAYVEPKIFDQAKIILNEIQDFRTVKPAFENNSFNVSGKMNLLKRGSVIFYDNEQDITSELEKYKNYRKIGFNQYIKL